MLFTTKTEYGLKALRLLARSVKNQAVPLSEISASSGLSLSYLEQIFAKLKRAEIIKSTKGAEGGYALNRPAKAISLLDIVEALEGRTAVNNCMAGSHQSCSSGCLTRKIWLEIQRDLEIKLKKYKLSDLI